jgi:carbohydrate-selective porin OprB
VARWLAPLLACAALGLPGTPVRAADPPASDPAASSAAAPTVRIVEHPAPYLRRRAAWLSEELRSLDDGTKAWLAWENATGDWGGLRPTLQEHGILLGLDYTGELFSNLHGGATTHDATHAAGLASLSLSLDTKRLGLWRDGTIVFSAEHQDGRGVSREVGSLSDIGPLDSA